MDGDLYTACTIDGVGEVNVDYIAHSVEANSSVQGSGIGIQSW
jgi:hypothetical protein